MRSQYFRYSALTLSAFATILQPLSAQAQFFYDAQYHQYANAIAYVQSTGFVQGYSDGTFRPDTAINRVEFLKILINAYTNAGAIQSCPVQLHVQFSDTDTTEWYAPYLCVARRDGIVSGYPDGTFRPADDINFVEAAKMISIVIGRNAVVPTYQQPFGTMNTALEPWYRIYVEDLERRGAIPLSIRSFDANLTRGEMAEIIYRLQLSDTSLPSRSYDDFINLPVYPVHPDLPYPPPLDPRACPPVNNRSTSSTVSFSSDRFGIDMEIPYSEDWGRVYEYFPPYVFYDEEVMDSKALLRFGPPSHNLVVETCDLEHAYTMQILRQDDVEDVLEDLEREPLHTYSQEPRIVRTGDFVTIEYVQTAYCTSPTIEVIGEDFNYRFSASCVADEYDAFEDLRDVIDSIDFYEADDDDDDPEDEYKEFYRLGHIPEDWSAYRSSNIQLIGSGASFTDRIAFSFGQDNVSFARFNWDQVDIALASGATVDRLRWELQGSGSVTWDTERIDGETAHVAEYPLDNGRVTRDGTGGKRYFLRWTYNNRDMGLIIWKQALGDREFEEGFEYFLDTIDLDEFSRRWYEIYPER